MVRRIGEDRVCQIHILCLVRRESSSIAKIRAIISLTPNSTIGNALLKIPADTFTHLLLSDAVFMGEIVGLLEVFDCLDDRLSLQPFSEETMDNDS